MTAWRPPTPTVALVANGSIVDLNVISQKIHAQGTIVAIDGGLLYCEQMKLTPSLILGDFDSASPALLQKYSTVSQWRNEDQNTTDLEKGLDFLAQFPLEKISVYGALGKRIDHTLTNITLLSRFPGKVLFETEKETLFVIDRKVSLTCYKGQTLSLIALNGNVTGITTSGLKWELENATLNKSFIGISNITSQETVHIAYETGDLLVCINY